MVVLSGVGNTAGQKDCITCVRHGLILGPNLSVGFMGIGIGSQNGDFENTGFQLVRVHNSSRAASLRPNGENGHIRVVLCYNEVGL